MAKFRDDDGDWPAGASNVKPLRPIAQQPPQQKPDFFPHVWVTDAKVSLDTRPIVKGIIEPGAFVVIYGPSGSGKSFFTADLAQHIATGALWRGRKTRQSLVVYVAAEAGASILRRFVAWRDHALSEAAEGIPLAILTRGPNLLASVQVEALLEQLAVLQAECGMPLGLVVFDTLSRSIHGGDENKAEDMTAVVNAADLIRDTYGAATAYVHHSGKDPTKGARGHSSLFAAADLVLGVSEHVAAVEKVRDGVSGERFPFSLEVVELGLDADGDAVTTCLLLPQADDAPLARKKDIRGIASIALDCLRTEISLSGQALPETSSIPRGTKAVQLDQWRARFRVRYGEDNDPRVRAKSFWRAKDALLAAGAIQLSDPWVWPL